MDDLLSEFVVETRETLERVGQSLLAWEQAPDDRRVVDEIFRFVHTVKGSCGFLDLPRIAALADAAETVLGDVRDGRRAAGPTLVTALLATIDRIGGLAFALGEPEAQTPAEADDLRLIASLATGRGEALPSESAAADPGHHALPVDSTVRVAVPLLDEIMTHLSDVVLARNELARLVRDIDDPLLTRSLDRLIAAAGLLREGVTRTRMQPVARIFAPLRRLVRDTAEELGKSVTLEISGHGVEIDREMGEAIRDPLLHIVRNAIDHGIESPEARRAAGKPATAVLRVDAWQAGNQIGIAVSDDGRGIDTDALVARAVASGRLDARRAAQLDARASAALVFEAGLSTAAEVSRISGRGVGMDVVRANVEQLGGVVTLDNHPGKGLTVTLRAPLTLSIVTALTIQVGAHRFAIPQASLDQVVALGGDDARIEDVAGAKLAVVHGTALPAFVLADALDLPSDDAPQVLLVIATAGGRRCAVAVDAICNDEELVVRAMAPQVAACGLYAGQSLNEDGVPIVLLDAAALVALAGVGGQSDRSSDVAIPEEASTSTETIVLARALDGQRIAVRSALVDRLVEIDEEDCVLAGGRLFVRVDGTLRPTVAVPLIEAAPAKLVAILLNDGFRAIVLAVRAVEDLVPIGSTVPVGDGLIEAVVESHGEPAMLLDGHALFAAAVPMAHAARPVASIVIPASPWAKALLAPMLEASGYRISYEPDEAAALTITLDEDDRSKPRRGVIALRSDGSGNVAVEHYDREALTRAIALAGVAA